MAIQGAVHSTGVREFGFSHNVCNVGFKSTQSREVDYMRSRVGAQVWVPGHKLNLFDLQ